MTAVSVNRRSLASITQRLFHDARSHGITKNDPRWPGWQVIVGVETHAQIKSRRKLFSHSLTSEYSARTPSNTNVSVFDAAFPGTLPKLNPICVDLAVRTALALQCRVQPQSTFDRKHYFFSDLPSGYQITQQYAPLAKDGVLYIRQQVSDWVPIRIKQIQLEQDTAKSTYTPRTRSSHIDLNRAGTALMEIVTEADLRSPEEVASYVRTLQSLLRAIGSSDGNMEDGSLRCDINVSLNRVGMPAGSGTRCEIKNLNSVKHITAAINHEVLRQIALLTSSPEAQIEQETRGFDESTFETFRLRSKEDAPDYRYMPDPNLGILRLSDVRATPQFQPSILSHLRPQKRVENIRATLPELPWVARERLKDAYSLSDRNVEVLLSIDGGHDVQYDGEDPGERSAVKYFDRIVKTVGDGDGKWRDPKLVANWVTHELLGQLASQNKTFQENTVSSAQLGELIDMVQSGVITGTAGKQLIRYMLSNPTSDTVFQIAKDRDLLALMSSPAPVSTTSKGDADPLIVLCKNAILASPSEVNAARNGNKNVINKIIGVAIKQSRGRLDARRVREVIEQMVFTESGPPS